eukprot:CAMPEP_0119524908 /NCGR_PEP_ID=MMETSP1344-20130328/39780_1 /TAXON_ID=236787 /ORGANISM="Florenciella parvula, Strain CCMP2471" /LENGTH=60 /DNA_ID=CAMNT_0007563537 /DNA_START=172 /DNA_END=350 /DNA_ORIENTATION=-
MVVAMAMAVTVVVVVILVVVGVVAETCDVTVAWFGSLVVPAAVVVGRGFGGGGGSPSRAS